MQRMFLMIAAIVSGCGRTAPLEAADGPSRGTTGTVTRSRARLPSPRKEPAVFNDGTFAYVIGGETQVNPAPALAEIVRYDPVADAVTVLPEQLPRGRGEIIAAWTGKHAFVFGGRKDRHRLTDEIVRYTPSTSEVRLMTARLPTPRYNLSVAWTGRVVLLLGGFDFARPSGVLAYDPETDTISTLAGQLIPGREATGYHWDGTGLWLVGGFTGTKMLDVIARYDADSDTVTRHSTRWPQELWAAASLFDGKKLWLLGGENLQHTYFTSIGSFDPQTGAVETSKLQLPSAHQGRSSTWLNGAGYIFGGVIGSGDRPVLTDEIIRFVP